MANPKYNQGQIIYLRESAAAGFLEPIRIAGVFSSDRGWVYTIAPGVRQPIAPAHYGERRNLVTGGLLHFGEEEFVDECTGLELAEAYLEQQLTAVQRQRAARCPEDINTDAT